MVSDCKENDHTKPRTKGLDWGSCRPWLYSEQSLMGLSGGVMPLSFCPLHQVSESASFAGLRRLADCLPVAKIAVWRSAILTFKDWSFLALASTFSRHIDQKVIRCNMNRRGWFCQ